MPTRSDVPSAPFLFSVDLEDVRDMVPGGSACREAVPDTTLRYLGWLERLGASCTFFVVGRTARAYPDLIREIVRRGHEVACHSDGHRPLTELGPEGLRADLGANMEALARCGAAVIRGFRAPSFSLTPATQWAWKVMREMGLTWSSSVLPARNPLFGWGGFGGERMVDGVLEIPVSVGPWPLDVPFAGGIYLRCLPRVMLRRLIEGAARRQEPLVGYVHPYDIDARQERLVHPHMEGALRLVNRLMYVNRDRVFDRLEDVIRRGFRIIPYRQHVSARAGAERAAGACS